MSSFEHFSHEHPLIFNKEKNIEEDINRDHFCRICSLPILLSSFYSCSVTGCQYFLHEPCAFLPRRIDNPWYFGYYLDLVKHEETCVCKRCDQKCKNLHYCDRPKFVKYDSLHPMCGAPVEIKSKHKSHPPHPLVAVCRETLARCNACGQEQKGYFFSCQPCNFWIHVDCALLPRFVKCTKHRRHPLILSYSINREYTRRCMICDKKVFASGTYLCGDCRRYAHLSCVAENMEDLGTETKEEIIDLPFDDLDALWSWTIKNLQKMKLDEAGNSTYDHNQLHDHGLILYNDGDHGINSSSAEPYISSELVCCNVCIQPIYPPFYACPQSHECHFHLHQKCSELPFRVNNPIESDAAQELRTWSTEESFCSLFCCILCGLPCNGLSYYHDSDIKDIACLSAPILIKHESHRQHALYRSDFGYRFSIRGTLKCCSVPIGKFLCAYACVDCDFMIHIHCALLPKLVKHKFDIHPLNLITTSIIKDDMTNSSDNLCEFCEEDIDTKFWYYGCEECNNLFHIKCIPSVGYLSKVKFGNSITVPCHPHRATFVRMLGYGSQTCGYCKEIIQGFVDDMAFHCSKCDFWMHFECGEECTGTEKFKMDEERTIQ